MFRTVCLAGWEILACATQYILFRLVQEFKIQIFIYTVLQFFYKIPSWQQIIMTAIYAIYLFTIVSTMEVITDSNFSSVFLTGGTKCFALARTTQQALPLIAGIEGCETYVGVLGLNSIAEERFHIKRSPYFLLSLSYLHQRYTIPFTHILTPSSIQSHLLYILSHTHNLTATPHHPTIYINTQQYQSIGISAQQITANLVLNPHYQHVQLHPNNNMNKNTKTNTHTIDIHNLQQLRYLMESMELQAVGQFNEYYYSVLQERYGEEMFIFLVVLDSVQERQESAQVHAMLQQIAGEYRKQHVYMFWTEGRFNLEKMVLLGFEEHHRPPLIGLLDVTSTNKYTMDPRKPFTEGNVRVFLDSFLNNQKTSQAYKQVQQKLHQAKIRTEVTRDNTLIYITTQYNQLIIKTLKAVLRRINRFMFDESFELVMPASYSSHTHGLFVRYREKLTKLPSDVLDCLGLENAIPKALGRDFPPHWCVEEENMREWLCRDICPDCDCSQI